MKSDVQANDFNRMIGSTILSIITHVLIPIFWTVFALFIVPRFAYGFAKLDFEIPALTGVVIKFSGLMSIHWFLYLFIILLLLVADGAVYYSLLRSLGKIPAGLWSFLVLLVEGIFTVLCIIALLLPMMKIISGIE
jgi:hypothetical protein